MYYCVAYRNPEGVLTSTVLTSDDVEEIIEVLGGEILLSSEKHHEASLYSEGFVDGLYPPRLMYGRDHYNRIPKE